MEKFNYVENFNNIEKMIFSNINLLEVARGYCENNYDKAPEIISINTIIEIILEKQKTIASSIDRLLVETKRV